MAELNVELCQETGICSIIKPDGKKVDLMPGEVAKIRDAAGDTEAVKRTLADVDGGFASSLDAAELGQVAKELKV